ncbi:helix-turn-helix domain-containing protein [Halalkalibacter kiskunsagensis]|uniref:Helix-turn-helix domain-containing protein n=1 Tax=Halalkalibacter kiskunsagensis TaxID=1548599 RepID=A0ABV6KFL5_9BACI
MITLLAKQSIDPLYEGHFASHKTFKYITELHIHDFYELFLITEGSIFHIINGEKILLTAGHLVFIRPDDQHYFVQNAKNTFQLLNLAILKQTVKELLKYLGLGFASGRLLDQPEPPQVLLTKKEIDYISYKFQLLMIIPPNQSDRIRTEIRSLLADLLIRHFSIPHKQKKNEHNLPSWLIKLENEMQKPDSFITGLKKLYECTHKSPEHISRTIKKYYGKTPTQWINDFRLEYAANLLIYSDKTIVIICFDSGFENVSYFYQLFKRKFTISPALYRKRHQRLFILN